MSRYGFQHEGKDVVVGWDNPIQTLFGDIGDYSITLDGNYNIQNVDELAEIMGVEIPSEIKEKLERDRDTAPAPTLLQARMGQLFRR